MNLTVVYKNGAFKITISKSKTLLDLKKEIANHFGGNTSYTGFNVLTNNKIIHTNDDNSKTLEELGIARMIRLPNNYIPGMQDFFKLIK